MKTRVFSRRRSESTVQSRYHAESRLSDMSTRVSPYVARGHMTGPARKSPTGSPGAPRGSRAAVARAAERPPPNSLRHTGDAGVFRCLDTLWDGLYEADPTGGVEHNNIFIPFPETFQSRDCNLEAVLLSRKEDLAVQFSPSARDNGRATAIVQLVLSDD